MKTVIPFELDCPTTEALAMIHHLRSIFTPDAERLAEESGLVPAMLHEGLYGERSTLANAAKTWARTGTPHPLAGIMLMTHPDMPAAALDLMRSKAAGMGFRLWRLADVAASVAPYQGVALARFKTGNSGYESDATREYLDKQRDNESVRKVPAMGSLRDLL